MTDHAQAPDPITVLDELEATWTAAQQALPGRDTRLDHHIDEFLTAALVRVGVDPDEAKRSISRTRQTVEERHRPHPHPE
ncbi:hypothetical protein [Streptomyces iconiensis]|uniref:Uncharacterized protein n=1 Tax=Streptomyces iconiensis TaxID=1384038 RepID=A0ABT7AA31_9ACTN|nr:hypothetical protein [Streptomyces iconiensis]MDJ1137907.1 hypothetical protein [Streptomyces iconiensis]